MQRASYESDRAELHREAEELARQHGEQKTVESKRRADESAAAYLNCPPFDELFALLVARKDGVWVPVQAAFNAVKRAPSEYAQSRFDAMLAWHDREQLDMSTTLNSLRTQTTAPVAWAAKPGADPSRWRALNDRFRRWYCGVDYQRAQDLWTSLQAAEATLRDLTYEEADYRNRLFFLTTTASLKDELIRFASAASRAPPEERPSALQFFVPDIGRIGAACEAVQSLTGQTYMQYARHVLSGILSPVMDVYSRALEWLGLWAPAPPDDRAEVGLVEECTLSTTAAKNAAARNISDLATLTRRYSERFAALQLQHDALVPSDQPVPRLDVAPARRAGLREGALPEMAAASREYQRVLECLQDAVRLNMCYSARADATELSAQSPSDDRQAQVAGILVAIATKTPASRVQVAYRIAVAVQLTAAGVVPGVELRRVLSDVHRDALSLRAERDFYNGIADDSPFDRISHAVKVLARMMQSGGGGALMEKLYLWGPLPGTLLDVLPAVVDLPSPPSWMIPDAARAFVADSAEYRVLAFDGAKTFKQRALAAAAALSGMFAFIDSRLCKLGRPRLIVPNAGRVADVLGADYADYAGDMTMRLMLVQPVATIIEGRARALDDLEKGISHAAEARTAAKREFDAAAASADETVLAQMKLIPEVARRSERLARQQAQDSKEVVQQDTVEDFAIAVARAAARRAWYGEKY